MTGEARHIRCPENVLGWIPWYADGSLTERQRGEVEAHAAQCVDCRSELDMISGAPFEIDVELPDPDRAFEQIMARISEHAEEPTAQILPLSTSREGAGEQVEDASEDWARLEAWAKIELTDGSEYERSEQRESAGVVRGPWMRSPSWAAAAAIVLVSLGALAGTVFTQALNPAAGGGDYDLALAATTEAALADAANTALIDVVFHETAAAKEIKEALRSIGGEIVSGPTNLGVYRVRLVPESANSDAGRGPSALDLEVALSRLKAAPEGVAIFAEVVP